MLPTKTAKAAAALPTVLIIYFFWFIFFYLSGQNRPIQQFRRNICLWKGTVKSSVFHRAPSLFDRIFILPCQFRNFSEGQAVVEFQKHLFSLLLFQPLQLHPQRNDIRYRFRLRGGFGYILEQYMIFSVSAAKINVACRAGSKILRTPFPRIVRT